MPNYNRIELVGHLVRDVESRFSQSGTQWANFSIAVNYRPGRDQEPEAIFWPVKCFKYPAKQVAGAKKGDCIWVEGSVQKEKWNDKKTNEPREKLVIVANNAFVIDHVIWEKSDQPTGASDDADDEAPF